MASIIAFTADERRAMTRPPDPQTVQLATNLLIAALYNFRRVTTGESDDLVSYGEVPAVHRECFYRAWAVPAAVQAIWRENDADHCA